MEIKKIKQRKCKSGLGIIKKASFKDEQPLWAFLCKHKELVGSMETWAWKGWGTTVFISEVQ